MKKKYTIKDVAKMAGVSKGTVDRVLHKRGKVSKASLDKVTRILKEINFKPNPIAKNLKTNKIYTIGILFPEPTNDPFWQPCLKSVSDFNTNYNTLGIETRSYYYSSPEDFTMKAHKLIDSKLDAILMTPLFFNEAQKITIECRKKGILVSTFNNIIKNDGLTNYIGQDLYQSGRTAAKLLDLLIGKGHILILHIDRAVQNSTYMQEKEKGFRSYFTEKNKVAYKISTLNIVSSQLTDINTILENYTKTNANINGLFITTSKTYIVKDFIKKQDPSLGIIGYDLIDENIKLLKEGSIDFLINQNPKKQLYLGLSFLAEHFLFGKNISKRVLIPLDIINSENYNCYFLEQNG